MQGSVVLQYIQKAKTVPQHATEAYGVLDSLFNLGTRTASG
jgi:hypothetical protein